MFFHFWLLRVLLDLTAQQTNNLEPIGTLVKYSS